MCYTYDAGPNACLYLLEQDVAMVTAVVKHFFPPQSNGGEFIRGLPVEAHTLNDVSLFLKSLISGMIILCNPYFLLIYIT